MLNGRPMMLRGTLECCIFPLTGYPPTDLESWHRIYRIAAEHGLNHLRFHSWCPPEAAFEAADEAGFYLQVEAPYWRLDKCDDDPGRAEFLRLEVDRILAAYGNHPSFCFLCLGNESYFEDADPYVNGILAICKLRDPRHLYTSTAHGAKVQPEDQFCVTADNMWLGGALHLFRGNHWTPTGSRFSAEPPTTDMDYSDANMSVDRPVVGHEVGQWCTYPNFAEITKYTGVLEPRNFRIVERSLTDKGMQAQADDFFKASAALSAVLYKEEVESSLRTPDYGGFQLLQLNDFPGQGTALVGLLDAFWDSKGAISADDFRRFCGPTVPLARLPKRVYTSDETLSARLEIAHYGPLDLANGRCSWELRDTSGHSIDTGEMPRGKIAAGGLTSLGTIDVPLHRVAQASEMTLSATVEADGQVWTNDWRVWVYPSTLADIDTGDVVFSRAWDRATRKALEAGRRVFLEPERLDSGTNMIFPPAFWTPVWFKEQPGIMGLLCDPAHPAFAEFPTAFHSDWQWWDIVQGRKCLAINRTPVNYRPLLQVIDRFDRNDKLAAIAEARVGRGRLLISFVNLRDDEGNRPAARQLRQSLLRYVSGPDFEPMQSLTAHDIERMFLLES